MTLMVVMIVRFYHTLKMSNSIKISNSIMHIDHNVPPLICLKNISNFDGFEYLYHVYLSSKKANHNDNNETLCGVYENFGM